MKAETKNISNLIFVAISLLFLTAFLGAPSTVSAGHDGSTASSFDSCATYPGPEQTECYSNYCNAHPGDEQCQERAEGSSATGTSDTECNFGGKEGFITSNPFGTEGDDYKKIPGTDTYCVAEQQGDDITSNPIFTLLNTIIQFLSAGIFIVGILMITVAGIQYITAGGNPEATKAARDKIGKVAVGLLLYFFFVAIMNFLIPGGIFN